MPLQLDHPYKILGNLSALLLVVGGGWLGVNRLRKTAQSGVSTAYDTYFLTVVVLVIATGILAEISRLSHSAGVAFSIYVAHLGMVLNLFFTFPYSKFAHMLYRTLALTHQAMGPASREPGHGVR